jgi:NAD dependent epimerase/dehydratase family enzyme
LRSQRVIPGVLTRAGFRWAYPTLESALRAAMDHTPSAAA